MEYWKRWSTGTALDPDLCRVYNNQASSKTQPNPIKLIEMSSAFLILGIGLSLATLAFIVEKIVWLSIIYSKKRAIIVI